MVGMLRVSSLAVMSLMAECFFALVAAEVFFAPGGMLGWGLSAGRMTIPTRLERPCRECLSLRALSRLEQKPLSLIGIG
ncbi:hypothetical protein D9M69_703360 [compost metagenome]